jgi:hypothetical protein
MLERYLSLYYELIVALREPIALCALPLGSESSKKKVSGRR